jgi:hypothetical protein
MTSRLQKVFENFSKSHYLYFTHVNTFFLEGVLRFHQTLKGACGTKNIRTPRIGETKNAHKISFGKENVEKIVL